MSYVRDMGKGRMGKDPRRQVILLMVLALPDDIVLPHDKQIVVEGDLNVDGTVRLNFHQQLVVKPDRSPRQEEYPSAKTECLRIDQVLTCVKWRY